MDIENKQENNKEHFGIVGATLGTTIGVIVGLILYVIGFFIAAILSWRCNAHNGFGFFSKLVFAFIVGLMSWSYLPPYAIYKWGTC